MKAIVYTKYGSPDVLQLKEVAKPVPKDHQVLVKVAAASINWLDLARFKSPTVLVRLAEGRFLDSLNQIIGDDIAGRVEAVGSNVTRFRPGDEVFGVANGALAEYACASEKNLVLKPAQESFEAAAAVPHAAHVALQGLRDKVSIQPGQKVLIQGASGGIGSYAVQIAKAFGAEVTAVCSTRNLALACANGAAHVIDYTREDFTRRPERYDVIVAVNGYHSILAYRRALRPGGTYVFIGGSPAQVLQALVLGPLLSRLGTKRMVNIGAKYNQKDLDFLRELLQNGQLSPVIDRVCTLSEAPNAIRQLLTDHAQGKVVIRI